ncbi:MAG: HlyD family efflux transporter periplasmic adaptor subunit [Alphaproteobacteria bacterium]|nr:MAG: HlyD family efflux transporter periplasmic adaptor subunit [Alphaproteobacteria bacterium]
MNKKLLAGIAGGAIAVIAGVSIVLGGGANAATGKYAYETVAVGKGDVARVISASGAVQPREKVEVGSEVSGRITAIYVDFNAPVKKDQVLAQVDPETFQNTLDQNIARLRQSEAAVDNSRAAIDRAKVSLDVAQKNYTRQKALYDQQAISQQAWELAEQTFTNAKLTLQSEEVSLKSSLAGLETSKASVSDSRTRLERTKIRSPIDGAILSREVEVGQTIQSSQSIKSLFIVAADLSQIEIQAAVVESDIGGIDAGDPVAFTVDAFPGERFQGSVVQVRQLGTETANVVTYTVVINARNPNGKLLPGMTANVEITADRASDVLRIAYDATRFQPPKEIQDAMREEQQRNGEGGQGAPGQGGGQQMGGGGQGGPGGGGGGRGMGGPGGGPQFGEMLKTAGVDEARATKIQEEMQGEMQKIFAASPGRQQQQPAGGIVGGPGFGPPPGMQQQQAMQERRLKMQQTQEAVFRRNLSAEEYAAVSKAMSEMQSQKRVTVYKVDDKGQLERHMLVIGLSDGSNAQIIRGAQEGDKFVVRASATDKGGPKS